MGDHTGFTATSAIAMGTNKITGLGDPTLAQDAVTKTYMESKIPELTGDTSYVSIMGSAFKQISGTAITTSYDGTEGTVRNVDDAGGDITIIASIQIPHGATVTGAVCYGAGTGDTWTLRRFNIAGAGAQDDLASAAVGTEDTTIANAVIDNQNYAYFFVVTTFSDAEVLKGARVKYTLP